jgi:capsular exopolysaccharide synthesis family protein
VGELTKQGIKLDSFREDIGHLEDMWRRLKGEHETLKVELQAPSRVEVREEATVKRVDVEKQKALMSGGAALGGLLFGLFAVSWLEFRTRRVDRVDEVVLGLGIRLVGTVPRVAKRSSQPASKPKNDKQEVLAESIDSVRTMLMHLARTQGLRTVMVTSAVAGEGKTSLSCRLAVSLAQAGLKTLLIDADSRNPSIHKVFGTPFESGFCEILCGSANPSRIQSSPVLGLSLIPAGLWSEQMPTALGQRRAEALFAHLSEQFDIILVDAPPVLPVADALSLGQQVDGVLLSVLCRVSRLNNLYAASQRIDELHIRTLGVVINGVEAELYGAKSSYPYPRKQSGKA